MRCLYQTDTYARDIWTHCSYATPYQQHSLLGAKTRLVFLCQSVIVHKDITLAPVRLAYYMINFLEIFIGETFMCFLIYKIVSRKNIDAVNSIIIFSSVNNNL